MILLLKPRAFCDVRIAARTLVLLSILAGPALSQSSNLDRKWQFLVDQSGSLNERGIKNVGGWRDVKVGVSWNAQFPDLRDYMGVAWYRTTFDAPASTVSRHLLLRFGAVDYYSEVFVNDKSVGTHEGGYTPFSFDVTDAARPGSNDLVVRVIDPPMDDKGVARRFLDMRYDEIPHGKQNWYVQTGGIWQPVTLEIRPKSYVERIRVVAQNDGSVTAYVRSNSSNRPPPFSSRDASPAVAINGKNQPGGVDLHVRVTDPSGKIFDLRPAVVGVQEAPNETVFTGRVPNPQLWDTSHPNLYTIEADLGNDRVKDRFGFRSFEARDGKFYLNGEPFYMIAALDQDFYPETIYSSPPEAFVHDEMMKAKRLGLNMLRCHIKVPDPVYLKVADEVGLLIWYEIPSWNDQHHFSHLAARRGKQTFAAMVARDWNHPCIVIQSIINESWGADLKEEEQRRWLTGAFDSAKELTAPLGRLIVDNSACCDNFHIKTDIEDNHRYNSIPDDHVAFDQWVADFSTHPKWNFSPYGDAQRKGDEPLVLSEFGNWGLPKLPKHLPWWFPRDFAGRSVTRPAGLFDRFNEFQFKTLFPDYDALAEATQWHEFISLKHEIEEIRRYTSIRGYVITEFTDINWEVNGLMDMWRNPKAYAVELAKIQGPDLILVNLPKYNFASGEPVEAETLISHYGGKDLTGAVVRWSIDSGQSGRFSVEKTIERGDVTALARISFSAPTADHPRRERLRIEMRDHDGLLIAENSYDLFLYPRPAMLKGVSLTFYDPRNESNSLATTLSRAGYRLSNTMSNVTNNTLLITTLIDDRVSRHLETGGRVVLLANSKDALPPTWPLKATPRSGSDLDGNWVTNFNWIRADVPPFSDVAITKILGFESDSVVPGYIIQGVQGKDYQDVFSGIFYGWLNNNGALAVQARRGQGRLFATTFRFERYGSDPYATYLFDAIIRFVNTPKFSPNLKMP